MPRKASCMQVSLLQGSAQFGSLSMGKLLFFFFLPPDPLKMGSLQAGFVSMSLGCSVNFSRILWKAGADFLAVAMVLLTQGGGGADPLSMLLPGSAGCCTHIQHTGNRKCFTLPCMRRRMVRVTLRPPSDTFPSFVFILALYLQYLKVASFFFYFFFLLFTQSTYRERERKKRKSTIEWLKLLWTENTMLYKPINIPSFDFLDYSLVLKRLLWLLSLPILFSPSPITR